MTDVTPSATGEAEIRSHVINRIYATPSGLTLDEARLKAQEWADYTDHLVKLTFWPDDGARPVIEILQSEVPHFRR